MSAARKHRNRAKSPRHTARRPTSPRHTRPWRRNPLLHRGEFCHRLFVGLVIAMVCALPALAFLFGRHQYAVSEEERQAQIASRHSVQATLQQNVHDSSSAWRGGEGQVDARVSWTAADGTVRTGTAPVEPPGRLGESTAIWLDTAGNPVEKPAGASAAYLDAASLAVVVLLAGIGVALVMYAVEHTLFMRSRMGAWEREWAEVAPRWTAKA